ncbi:hypothetical protein PF008_g12089 [Phytophthora fragariae]|uniref:Uncharacterized protein n=1 Tax=Phytophthora fragariae TaxID=53985 RepID=A0A6G0RQG3_9STRA|nr:hypothetical protein PF008_g12089 [Phytophthora fragariae]
MAVLKWALANYPEPEQLVICDYSAGSLAAQMWSAYVANTLLVIGGQSQASRSSSVWSSAGYHWDGN